MPLISISKTYEDDEILFEQDLDNIREDVQTFLNVTKLDSDNLQDAGIITAKLADSSVTNAKIADGTIERAKVASSLENALVPTGTILAYGGATAPSGFLTCDGSAISRTTFDDLYTAIGDAHGNGDGSTTFNLPDLRGRFLRGVDGGALRDPDAASRTAMQPGGNTGDNVGSVQDHELDSHNHSVTDPGHVHPNTKLTNTGGPPIADGIGYAEFTDSNSATTGISINNQGGNETRPINANVTYIIKT